MRLGAVVPAAGLSRRMGREKVLLPFGRSTMLETVLSKLRAAGVERVVVVVRPDLLEAAARARDAGADVAENLHPEGEMIESIRLGIAALPADLDAFFVWPADHPAVLESTLERLTDRAARGKAVLPVFGGRRGHPALVGADLRDSIGRIPARDGLRRLWRDRADAVEELPVDDPGVLENLDDPESYERARLREAAGRLSGGTGEPA
ncbi:MAG: nucleotidyltransferase family protein [Acidobacteriota bacterium]|nr:nucleotidyltransferase family protein [Acidobacteriota bacterium]